MNEQNIDSYKQYLERLPKVREHVNDELVTSLEQLGKRLGNLQRLDVWEGSKKRTLPENTLAFTTIEDDPVSEESRELGRGLIRGQTITFFYLRDSHTLESIAGVETELHLDDVQRLTGIDDKPRIFSHMVTDGRDYEVSGKELTDFLIVVSGKIKNGIPIEKIKFNPERRQMVLLK